MTLNRNRLAFLAAGASALSAALLLPGAALAKAEKTAEGRTLVVPEEHKALGATYFVHSGRDAQVTFTSDAPLEHIKGTSSAVLGYAIWGGADKGLVAGEFHLPVASIDTGIPMRDEHLQGSRWLNAESNPDIVFVLAESRAPSVAQEGDGFKTYSLTLVGDMTVKDVTREMSIPARVTLMEESQRTKSRAPGNLIAIRCEFEILLGDFGVKDDVIGLKVADQVTLDIALFGSTVSPDELMRARQQGQNRQGGQGGQGRPERPQGGGSH